MKALPWLCLPLFAYQVWTVVGWLADGPRQITAGRDSGSASWVTARIVEGLIVVSMVAIATVLIRQWRREGRMPFDAILVVAIGSAAFWDPIYNWLEPAWLYSPNWLNVNDWFGHAPFVPNAQAGETPWAIGPVLVGYAFWGLGFAYLENRVMARFAHRLSTRGLVLLAYGLSGVITVIAFAFFVAADLMSAPGYSPDALVFFYSGALVFGSFSVLRYFKLLDHGSTLRRLFATVAACQLLVIVGWGLLTVPLSA